MADTGSGNYGVSQSKPRKVVGSESLLVSEFSVRKLIKILKSFDESKLRAEREKYEKQIMELGENIRPISRDNWDLEETVAKLDDEIAMALKRLRSQEKHAPKKQQHSKLGDIIRPFDGNDQKQGLFEDMFSLLLHEPRYLARLAHKTGIDEIEDFVKAVLVDMFGGRPEFEAVLLQMFSQAMALEFEKCQRQQDFGAVFRNKSAALTCLKEYALQGKGKEVINDMIRQPVESLCQYNANLEVDAGKMYKTFVSQFEQKTGKTWPEERKGLSSADMFNKPYIQKLYQPRIEALKKVADQFFHSVHSNVSNLPRGIRWICKELAHWAKEYFPDSSPYQRGGIVGGFIFLRLLNPRITMPYHFDVISDKPKKETNASLKAVTRILQKLSNGTTFKNELEFVATNDFLEEKRKTFQNFIYEITDVEGLDFETVLYELNKHKRDRKVTVQTTYNQLLLFHRLFWNHKKTICTDPQDPMLPILIQLGPPLLSPYPEKPKVKRYKMEDNNVTVLYLKTPGNQSDDLFDAGDSQQFDNAELFASSDRPPEIERALQSIISFGQCIDTAQFSKDLIKGHDFHGFLQHVVNQGGEAADRAQSCIYDISEAVEYLKRTTGEDFTIRKLIISFSEQIRVYRSSSRRLRKHVSDVNEAYKSIMKHKIDLTKKIDFFEQYLESVQGGGNVKSRSQGRRGMQGPRKVTLSGTEMKKKGIIHKFSKNLEKYVIKSATYTISRVEPGVYELNAVVKKAGFKIFQDKIPITMMEILEMIDQGQHAWAVNEHIELNVNLLKKLIDDSFGEGF